ncbi:MAG: hypothetical protein ABR608_02530, partial [Pseudonocardiaceae bacterium]
MSAFDAMDDKFHLTTLSSDPADGNGAAAPPGKASRINLLNWDGQSTNGLFPARQPTNGAEHTAEHTR